jgi:hypothetical protein
MLQVQMKSLGALATSMGVPITTLGVYMTILKVSTTTPGGQETSLGVP